LVLPLGALGLLPGGNAEPLWLVPTSGFTGPVPDSPEAAKADTQEMESRPVSARRVIVDLIMVRLQLFERYPILVN
jgi:hypothetical protein